MLEKSKYFDYYLKRIENLNLKFLGVSCRYMVIFLVAPKHKINFVENWFNYP